jgi:hypothetical protein
MKWLIAARLLSVGAALTLASCAADEGSRSQPTKGLAQPKCSLAANFLGYDGQEPLLALAFRNQTERPLLLYRWFESAQLSAGDEPPDSTLELDFSAPSGKELSPTKVPSEYFALYDPPPPLPQGLTLILPGATYRTSMKITEDFGLNSSWELPVVTVVRFRSDAASWFKGVSWRSQVSVPTGEFCDSAASDPVRLYRDGPRSETLKLIRRIQATRGNKNYTARLEVSPEGVLTSCRIDQEDDESAGSICQSLKRWKFAKHERNKQLAFIFPSISVVDTIDRGNRRSP